MKADVIIVGGGHNGLVCAAYLAARGKKIVVLERRPVLGGAAVTEEFHPGFRNSLASYTVSLLHPEVIRDLRLYEHGLRIIERPFANFLPQTDGSYFKLGGSVSATQQEVAKFSRRDAERLPSYYAMLERSVLVLREMLMRTPPVVAQHARLADWWAGLNIVQRTRKLDDRTRGDLLDLFTRSAGDLLDSWFESDPLKAALGWDSVVGNFASPYSPGSAYVLLHHVFGEVNGKPGAWGHALGGMGAITQAMARECRARGVSLLTEAEVHQIEVDEGQVQGVVLSDGRTYSAPCVVGNVAPPLLYGKLLEQQHLPEDFRQRLAQYQCGSASFRLNVALSELPDFTCLPGTESQPHHGAGILFAPHLAYMERAYFDARSHEHNPGWSREPIVELNLASVLDQTLAPAGQHVASIFCQHFDPALREAWTIHKSAAVESILNIIDRHAPNFKRSILALQILSPWDLEQTLGLVNGDIFHGALQLSQLWAARPVLGYGNYGSPIRGLYLCGSGAHPGGGVTGLPGRNAAREILRSHRFR
jgi:phytoene dehydrogenase-like protein